MTIPIVDDEIRKRELVRIEQERSDAECENGDPEIEEVWCPPRHGDIEKHDQCPHPEVYTWTSEAREEDAKGQAGRSEASSGSNIPSPTERKVADDRMRVDLGRKYFKHR